MKWYPLVLAALLVQSVWAGSVEFKNGDKLAGELKSMDADNIVWISDSLGEVIIAKSKVDNLSSSELVKLDGHEEPCAIVGMDGPKVVFSCAGGITGDAPLLTLNNIQPYENYLMGASTFTGRVSLAGYQDRGNKTEDSWVMDSSVEYRRGDYRNSGLVQFDSKTKEPLPRQDRSLFEYQLDWFFAERWFWTNTLAYSNDDAKLIRDKYRVGSGLGYQFWENDITALSVRSGISYVDEYFIEPALVTVDFVERDKRTDYNLGINYRYKFGFGASFFHNNNYAVSNEDSANWQFDADTGFAMPIIGGVFTEVKYEYDYKNQPQANTEKTDTRFTLGVGYQW